MVVGPDVGVVRVAVNDGLPVFAGLVKSAVGVVNRGATQVFRDAQLAERAITGAVSLVKAANLA